MFCFHPPNPRHPQGHHFFCCSGLLITIFLSFTALINHYNSFIFQCRTLFSLHFTMPRLFYPTHFSSDPGPPGKGMGQNNSTGALALKIKAIWQFLKVYTGGTRYALGRASREVFQNLIAYFAHFVLHTRNKTKRKDCVCLH